MDLQLNPLNTKSRVAVHVQLEEQLKHLILSGELAVGERLPSIRALAGFLRINRNTVARVVADLEREGYLETRRGSGAFVVEPPVDAEGLKRQRLLEQVMRQAVAEGVSVEDLGYELLARAGAMPAEKVRIAFVECNRPQVEHFSADLEEQLSVVVDGMLIEELEERAADNEELPWRLVATTFFHVQEVEELVGERGIETFALLDSATMGTIRELGNLPEGTEVGVIGNSPSCSENLLRSLKGAGIEHLKLSVVPDYKDTKEVLSLIRRVPTIVCGSVSALEVEKLATGLDEPRELKIIVEQRSLDRAGVEMLGRMLRR